MPQFLIDDVCASDICQVDVSVVLHRDIFKSYHLIFIASASVFHDTIAI